MYSQSQLKQKHVLISEYLTMKKYAKARVLINECLSQQPESPVHTYANGLCLYGEDKIDEAIEAFMLTIKYGGERALVYYYIGRCKEEKKMYKEAELDLLEALKQEPNNPDILVAYGWLMYITDHDKKALALYEKALKIDPSNGQAVYKMLLYHLHKGKKVNRVEAISRVYNSDNTILSAEIYAGVMELNYHNTRKARGHFKKAYLLDPTNKDIESILDSLAISNNPFIYIQNFVDKLGGVAVLWIGVMVALLILRLLGPTLFKSIVSYVVMAIYVGVMLTVIYITAKD